MKNSILRKTMILSTASLVLFTACKKETEEPMPEPMMSSSYNYEFNNGQVVPTAAYDGEHSDNLTAQMKVEEIANGRTKITLTLMNTVQGAMYHIHAHDAADPATTPNGTPYNESPNAMVFSQMLTGNGSDVSVSQETDMSYASIVNNYEGFLVVHDPLQPISTTDISTYLVVGTFARMQAMTNLMSMTFAYNFNTGQVSPSFAYMGTHPSSLMGQLKIQALANGMSRVTVMLGNTLAGEIYHVHAHDVADPMTTPNGTPYDETPNHMLCSMMIEGTGGMTGKSQMADMSYSDIVTMYEGFFVVHDPLQGISTTDPTTYVLLGLFARM